MKLLLENWQRYLLTESYILDEDFFESSIQQLFDKLKAFGDSTWIFFDTETTGFKPESAQLTEIGAFSHARQLAVYRGRSETRNLL